MNLTDSCSIGSTNFKITFFQGSQNSLLKNKMNDSHLESRRIGKRNSLYQSIPDIKNFILSDIDPKKAWKPKNKPTDLEMLIQR